MSKAAVKGEEDLARREEAKAARIERDEKLLEITSRYAELIEKLRSEGHKERQKVWKEWRERRNDAS